MYYTNIIYIRFFFIDGEKKIIKKLCRRKKYFSGSRQGSSKRAQTKSTAIVCMILSPIYLIYSMLSIFFQYFIADISNWLHPIYRVSTSQNTKEGKILCNCDSSRFFIGFKILSCAPWVRGFLGWSTTYLKHSIPFTQH